MFCPRCECEYRPGFTHCPDCDVDLVSTLAAYVPVRNDSARSILWEGPSEQACVDLCHKLREAKIPYEVSRIEESRRFKLRIDWPYQITVSSQDSERAAEVAGKPGAAGDQATWSKQTNDDQDAYDQSALELPAEDESSGDEEARAHSYDQPFYTEDASEKIGEASDVGLVSMIEASLRENLIHVRTGQNGTATQFFVLPEDASRAREIVREILDASPPR